MTAQRVAMMRVVKGKIADIEQTINKLRDETLAIRNASSQQQVGPSLCSGAALTPKSPG